MTRSIRLLALVPALLACQAAPVDKGAEEDAPLDGAADSFRNPIDHSALALGGSVSAEITRDESFHAWTFELTAPASIALRTEGAREVDTMLYLYREGARGWGSYIARNDDAGGTLWSALSRDLVAGRYRVIVKGYDRRVRGAFTLASECSGEGCPREAGECLFGTTYRQLRDSALFEPLLSTVVRSPEGISSARAAQIVAAVRVAYEDASDLASALEAVDQNEVNVLELAEVATGRRFVVIEYGAGDNSYGAVLVGDTSEIAAEIHDGDLYECVVLGAPGGARIGADCEGWTGNTCAEGLRCQGFVEEQGAGRCAPEARLEGEGALCSASVACPSEQLVCGGLTRGDEGICVPTWLRGSYGEGYSIEIGDAAVLERSVIVYGLATVDVDVEIRTLIDHPRPSDLRVTLTNPVGTEVVVFEGDAEPGYVELDGSVRGFSGDEQVNGTWTLRVADRASGEVGTLERWAIDVTSRWD
ncbi:DVUA0089 family protein [Sandaracinus amylolyticus]|uniref:DVUA0089 family protein n=1 Tax=Sandaracinus amylolyticus TaxID=927083 RepID=UPI001F1908F6|nr:DVUA0089 family protein [Sandaracinus amylolyticus]UJR86737.1 Hypothetical protein I5071_88380 [Sandaracinus amylolyticus]